MSKRSLLLLVIFLLPIVTIFAQKSDQVTLKNGSVIRGSIIEIIPNGKVTIEDAAGNTWVFQMDEIDHINQVDQKIRSSEGNYPKGWTNMTSIGFLAGAQNSMQTAPFSLISSFGYKHEMGIYTGVATGIEFLNINHIPVMADIQYFLRSSEVTPVIIFRGGYELPTKGGNDEYYNYSGGLTGSIGIGLKIRSKENFAWDISAHYRYMNINYSYMDDWSQQTYKYTDVYNRLELRLGFYLN